MLPVAAASGWWAAVYSQGKRKARSRSRLNSAYGQGLNYLLNEESDKATEVLIQMLEVDPDTVELHLALGSLFRRRGEVDRAIRIHQNIIARSKLSEALRSQATLELGRDFFSAGLLDRAERLFQSLLGRNIYEQEACQHLVDLYQQGKEWENAIEIGRRLVPADSERWTMRIAQYHCEIGEAALRRGEYDLALQQADNALQQDPGCVRATLLTGNVCERKGNYPLAIESYQRVEKQNPGLMQEVIDEIHQCFTKLGDIEAWNRYLSALSARCSYLLLPQETVVDQQLQELLARQARYRCEECGFTSRKLFWQCPGCRCWSSVKPIRAGRAE